MMGKIDWMRGLAGAAPYLIALLVALIGGYLLGMPAPIPGMGLTLIVLLPWVLTELTKERPPVRKPPVRRKS